MSPDPSRPATSDRPVFVVGCARSGTTLLEQIIDAHPRLAMPQENRFLLRVYEDRVQLGDLRISANVDKFADAVIKKENYAFRKDKFSKLGIDEDTLRRRLHETPGTVGSKLGTVLESYATASGKPRWGDKRPAYIQNIDLLIELFPDAQIIHLIRDGRDCVSSLKHMPWWTYGYNASVYKWRAAIQAGQQAVAALPPDQFFELRYEDLTADPETSLQALCAFLDEEFNSAMLMSRDRATQREYKGWHENVGRPVNKDAEQRWTRDLTPDEIALFEDVAGDELGAWGYNLSGGRKPRWSTRRRYAGYETRKLTKHADTTRLDAETRRAYAHPVAAALTSRQIARAKQASWYEDYALAGNLDALETAS